MLVYASICDRPQKYACDEGYTDVLQNYLSSLCPESRILVALNIQVPFADHTSILGGCSARKQAFYLVRWLWIEEEIHENIAALFRILIS